MSSKSIYESVLFEVSLVLLLCIMVFLWASRWCYYPTK